MALSAIQQVPESKKDIRTLTREATKAVVLVVTSDAAGEEIRQGSGFLVSSDGKVVTNFHVIERASSAIIKLSNGAFYLVDGVLAADKDKDIAVLQASGKDFPTVPLGDSDKVEVGEEVVAIGSPLALEGTVSNGIVSAIRHIKDQNLRLFQTTTPISPGSSGGALFDLEGKVIGITTFQATRGQNLNFAIPITYVKPLLSAKSLMPLGIFGSQSTGLTGVYSGTVYNMTGSLSAKFEITVREEEGNTISGCMAVHRPLYGSGGVRGEIRDSQVSFDVLSASFVIKFSGRRVGPNMAGTYLVLVVDGSTQQGKFELRLKEKKLPRKFDPENCPDDSTIH